MTLLELLNLTFEREHGPNRDSNVKIAPLASVAEPFDDEAVRGVNADRDEPFLTDGSKAVWGLGRNNDDIARPGNDLLPVDGHCCLT